MSIHLYLIKSFRNNFITLLHLHKSLNYESSSMRNDYILFENNVVALAEKLRNHRNKKKLNEQREVIEH